MNRNLLLNMSLLTFIGCLSGLRRRVLRMDCHVLISAERKPEHIESVKRIKSAITDPENTINDERAIRDPVVGSGGDRRPLPHVRSEVAPARYRMVRVRVETGQDFGDLSFTCLLCLRDTIESTAMASHLLDEGV